jgi:hypothetical protein
MKEQCCRIAINQVRNDVSFATVVGERKTTGVEICFVADSTGIDIAISIISVVATSILEVTTL